MKKILMMAVGVAAGVASAADYTWFGGTGVWDKVTANWSGAGSVWSDGGTALFTGATPDWTPVKMTENISAAALKVGDGSVYTRHIFHYENTAGLAVAGNFTVQGYTGSQYPGAAGAVFTNGVVSVTGTVGVGRAILKFGGSSGAVIQGKIGGGGLVTSADWGELQIDTTGSVYAYGGIDGNTEAWRLSVLAGTLYTPFIRVSDRNVVPVCRSLFDAGRIVATGSTNSFIQTYPSSGCLNSIYIGGGLRLDTAGYDVGLKVNLTNEVDYAYTGGLTKLGTGTLTLYATNSYVGATDIREGVLKFAASSKTFLRNVLYVRPGAELDITANPSLVFSGTGTLRFEGTSESTASIRVSGAQAAKGLILRLCYTNGPAVVVAGGALNLDRTVIDVVNVSGANLSDGVYPLASGVTGVYPYLRTVSGLSAGKIGHLSISDGVLYLTVSQTVASTWSGAQSITTNDTDVAGSGTTVYAFNFSGGDAVLNGVRFAAAANAANPVVGVTTTLLPGQTNATAFAGTGSGIDLVRYPASGYEYCSSEYRKLLKGAANPDASFSVSFAGLISGARYLAQFWVNDSRANYSGGRRTTFGDGTGSATLIHNRGDQYSAQMLTNGLGQYVTAEFTAAQSTWTFSVVGSSAQINAVQLRRVSGGVVTLRWNGGDGDVWDLTSPNWLDANGLPTVWFQGADAVFDGSGQTVLVADAVQARQVRVAAGAYAFNGSGSLNLTEGFANQSSSAMTVFVKNDVWIGNSGSGLLLLKRGNLAVTAGGSGAVTVSGGTVRLETIPKLPTEGLSYRLSADTGVTADAQGVVSSWTSTDGQTAFTQANSLLRPVLQTSTAFGGKSVVRFGGASNSNRLDLSRATTNRTVLLVYNAARWVWVGGVWGHLGIDMGIRMNSSQNQWVHSLTAASGTFSNGGVFRTNGVPVTVASPGMTLGRAQLLTSVAPKDEVFSGPTAIGCYYTVDPKRFFDGEIAEIAVYNRVLSDEERSFAESYLATRWGVVGPAGMNLNPAGIPSGSQVVLTSGTLDLNGQSAAVASVTGGGTISNGTLTVTGKLTATINPDGTCDPLLFSSLTVSSGAELAVTGLDYLRSRIKIIGYGTVVPSPPVFTSQPAGVMVQVKSDGVYLSPSATRIILR